MRANINQYIIYKRNLFSAEKKIFFASAKKKKFIISPSNIYQ